MNAAKPLDSNSATESLAHPLPDDFDLYLPWANKEMEGDSEVVVVKMMQEEYINIGRATDRSKSRDHRSKAMPSPTSDNEKSTSWRGPLDQVINRKVVKIITTYDYADKLVHLKFDRNIKISRKLMKLIGMILKFQTHLTGVTINRGMDMHTVHELNNWLPITGITDICLDNTFIKEANYHILLETQSLLKNLSLARCKITDQVIKNIASKLYYPLPASQTLVLLNLSSNGITDLGAMYLSEALRSNRKLYYLNLADNIISDDGALRILNTLTEFLLTNDEIMSVRSKHMNYLKRRAQLATRIFNDLKVGDFDKKASRKKSTKIIQSTPKKVKGLDREASAKTLAEAYTRSTPDIEAALRVRSENMAENMIGKFNDPFMPTYTKVVDDLTYCLGNNVLCYISLAYNNLGYISVKKLLNVVVYQKMINMNPRGLVNVCIEGNNIPVQCVELAKIDELLAMGLKSVSRKMSINKGKSRAPMK